MSECDIQSIYSEIGTSDRLSYYLRLNPMFPTEYYIMNIRNREFRRYLCLLRLDELPIQTTIGRRQGLDKSLCFCRQCNKHEVEDLIHFLFICPRYEHLRKQFILPVFFDNPTFYSYKKLVCCKDHDILLNVAKYVKHCISLRRE